MEYQLPCGIILTIDFDRFEDADSESGYFNFSVNHWWVSEVGGKRCSVKVSDWLRKRLDAEWIENELVERYY